MLLFWKRGFAMDDPAKSKFTSPDKTSSEWRRAQMIENNLIEGVTRDPALSAITEDMQDGLSPEEKIARLVLMHTRPHAAE